MVDYYIDNYSFKGFGIIVQESTGVVDLPKFKPPTEHDWAEYNGKIVDTEKKPRTEARQIQLKCALSAANQTDFLTKVSAFQSVFMTKGLKRLAIVLTHDVGLFYDVYMSDGLQITKRWRDSQMVGQFTVTLTEPEPRKKIIRYDSQDSTPLTISFKNTEAVSVYWGDGEYSQDLYGDVSLSHTYDEPGIYFAIIHGNIEDLSEFSTNGDELGANNGGAIDIDVPEILNDVLTNVELYTTAEPDVSTPLAPYLKFTFNNNGDTRYLRIAIDYSLSPNMDSVLSETSPNAVRNSAITAGINAKADKNHTHQITDVVDLNSTLNNHNTRITNNNNAISTINGKIGSANGIAQLDGNSKVPKAQLPGDLDDVREYASVSAFPVQGESGVIYIAQDTNMTYRWNGTSYANIGISEAERTKWNKVDDALMKVSDFSTYQGTDGETVIYVGESTSQYKYGCKYRCTRIDNCTGIIVSANPCGIEEGLYLETEDEETVDCEMSRWSDSEQGSVMVYTNYVNGTDSLNVGDFAWNVSKSESYQITEIDKSYPITMKANNTTYYHLGQYVIGSQDFKVYKKQNNSTLYRGEHTIDGEFIGTELVYNDFLQKETIHLVPLGETFGNATLVDNETYIKWEQIPLDDEIVNFTPTTTRENINTGESESVLWSKISKILSDLKDVAFSGNYGDLQNKPTVGNGKISIKHVIKHLLDAVYSQTFKVNDTSDATIRIYPCVVTGYRVKVVITNNRIEYWYMVQRNDENAPTEMSIPEANWGNYENGDIVNSQGVPLTRVANAFYYAHNTMEIYQYDSNDGYVLQYKGRPTIPNATLPYVLFLDVLTGQLFYDSVYDKAVNNSAIHINSNSEVIYTDNNNVEHGLTQKSDYYTVYSDWRQVTISAGATDSWSAFKDGSVWKISTNDFITGVVVSTNNNYVTEGYAKCLYLTNNSSYYFAGEFTNSLSSSITFSFRVAVNLLKIS